jgi:site-specific recombinase XerD
VRLRRRKRKPTPKHQYPAEYLTRDEVLALLYACGDTPVGKRNRALIVVMWRAGLRLAEALALRVEDLDSHSRTIRVMHGKGDKARTVAMDSQAWESLEGWLRSRSPHWWDSPVFCTLKGGPLSQSYVRAMLPRLAKKAGVTRRVHAHVFRHTFAVELVRAGTPVPLIQRLLGHSSLATTSIYLGSLSPEEALDVVRERSW